MEHRLYRPEMTYHWRDSVIAGRTILTKEVTLACQPQSRSWNDMNGVKRLKGVAAKAHAVRSDNLERGMVEYLTTKTSMRQVASKWGLSTTTLCRHLGALNQVTRKELLRKHGEIGR